MELIKQSIYMVLGAIILCVGIIGRADAQIAALGACVFGFSAGLFAAEYVNNKHKDI